LNPRDVLAAAWRLFQVSVVNCVPLAILAVAASAVPGAEAASNSEGRGFTHSHEWWGVLAASTVLTLICYGAVLRIQFGLVRAQPELLIVALRKAALGVPRALLLIAAVFLPLVPAAAYLAWRGSGAVAVLFTFIGCVPLVLGSLAWPLDIAMESSPWAAYRKSIELARSHWSALLAIIGIVIGSVLVFALLASVLMAVVINLAGPGAQTSAVGLGVSRWMMAGVLSLPIVFAFAAAVVTCQALLAPTNATSKSR
jgi:hypothetical protein